MSDRHHRGYDSGPPPSRYDDRDEGYGGPPRGRSGAPPAGRIYVGNLPVDCDKKTLDDLFGKYGRITEMSLKSTVSGTPFAFIEYEDPRDAQEAIQARDGYSFDGSRLRVELPFAARGSGGGGGYYSGPRGPGGRAGPPRRGEFRVVVKGLPPSGSWQDLKDHMRDAGECVYADVFRDGTGMVEYSREEDMEYAIRQFDDSRFTSHEGETSRIYVSRAPDTSGGGRREYGRGGRSRSRSRSFDDVRRGGGNAYRPPASGSDYYPRGGPPPTGGVNTYGRGGGRGRSPSSRGRSPVYDSYNGRSRRSRSRSVDSRAGGSRHYRRD